MEMVHRAYDSLLLLKDCPSKIQSIGSYDSKLLICCLDCSLRIYTPQSNESGTSAPGIRRESYVLQKTVEGFSKKPVTSMEVSVSRALLISLSDSIAFHRLPKLEAVSAKAKGANICAWDDRRGFLCFGRQKKVGIFRLEGSQDFEEVKEFTVPDVVMSMAWCGENICLGIKREYIILNSTNGVLSEIFPSGRITPPLVVALPSGKLLLGKDNIGVFVDQNGKLVLDGSVCWSQVPASVVIHMAYAIARLSKHIEIRSLRSPYPLVQTVALNDSQLLVQSNNYVFSAGGDSVYGLFSVPVGAQIVQLTASGKFEEALTLCKLLSLEDSALRKAKEDSIHIRYGQHLFSNGNYEEAMEQFLTSSVDIIHVLNFYPSLVLPKVIPLSGPEGLTDIELDAPCLSRVPSDASDETESSSSQESERSSFELKKMSYNALIALAKFLQRKRVGIIEKATSEVTEQVISAALTTQGLSRSKCLSKSHHHTHVSSNARDKASLLDTALLQALLLTGQSAGLVSLLKSPNYCDIEISEEFLRQRSNYTALLELYKCNEMHQKALDLLSQLVEESDSNHPDASSHNKFKSKAIVDYLKPLCKTDPMLVLDFSAHALESYPAETIELLVDGNVPPELVNSYLKQHAPKMQAPYLELVLARNENEVSSSLWNELVNIYLLEVVDWYADLKGQKRWDEKEYSPERKKLLGTLERISSSIVEILLARLPSDALYEEQALLYGKMNQHEQALSLYVHKLQKHDLALAYCDRVYARCLHHFPRSHTNIYLMLLQLYVNPQRKMKRYEQKFLSLDSHQSSITDIPKGGLHRVRGHRSSKKIAEIEGSEDVQISTSSTDSGRSDGDIDVTGENGDPIMLERAIDLLCRKWDRINGSQALKFLPREIKLQNLLPFLAPLLKKTSDDCRNISVIRNLRQQESWQVKEEFYKQRRAVVKITSSSMCFLCNKRIGGSVFAVYPNGVTIVHFVCFRDSQSIKAMGDTSPK